MSQHWFTSDLHFGHGNIMKYCRRTKWMTPEEIRSLDENQNFKVSYDSVLKMNRDLIDTINSLVKEDDVLWHMGDFCFGPREEDQFIRQAENYRRQIKCRTINQVWGNHDGEGRAFRERYEKAVFSFSDKQPFVAIADNGQYWLEDIDPRGCDKALRSGATAFVLNHYAMLVWDQSHRGAINLYGHSHSGIEKNADTDLPGRRNFDVGIDNSVKLLGEYRPFSLADIKSITAKRPGWRHEQRLKNSR